jgi:hypothetical protein
MDVSWKAIERWPRQVSGVFEALMLGRENVCANVSLSVISLIVA